MEIVEKLLDPAVLIFLIPVVAILGVSVRKILRLHYDHQERMARIEAGYDPEEDDEQD
ncbi:MAG: hypothetical protein IH908_13500 [Proteobacteria bacterium]|nr:hypothetical protein [Pseudomonadota bacterium]